MTTIADDIAQTWREYVTYGVSASGANEPVKQEIRALMHRVDLALSTLGVAAGGAITVKYATLTELEADLAHDAGTLAIVYDDDRSPSESGIYAKAGASGTGSWELTDVALPADFSADLAYVLSQLELLQDALTRSEAAAAAAAVSAANAAISEVNAAGSAVLAEYWANIAEASAFGPFLTDLSDVDTVNAYLQANAGQTIRVFAAPGPYHEPNFLATGDPIIVPANTCLLADGIVEIRSDNPTRQAFHLEGDGAKILGNFRLIGDYIPVGDYAWQNGSDFFSWLSGSQTSRPNFEWAAGEYTPWALAWNDAHPDFPIAGWLVMDWQTAWNTAMPQSQYANLGALSKNNRTAAITSYDASNLIVDGPYISNFHTSVTFQGNDITALSAADTPRLQTYGNILRNLTLDQFDFGILCKKQRDFNIDGIKTEWVGWRVNRGQPHLIYLSNSTDAYEESWNVSVGTLYAVNYEGGSVFKARGCKNLTWGAVLCRSVHSAIAIVEACTGAGGTVLVTDQHQTSDPEGAGSKFAVNITNSPGFIIEGAIRIQQRAGEDQMKGISVENSSGARFTQGSEVICARATDEDFLHRVRSSSYVYSGPCKYTDTNGRNTLLWTMSDSQEEGGNASDCVLEFAQITGTTKLAQFVGLSSDNQVWVDPTKVDNWDPLQALVDDGLGGGNVLIDPRATARKVVEINQSTALSLKASGTLTIVREGPDPLDEDALPPPYVFSDGDTVTFAGRTYTWRTVLSTGPTVANEILIPSATIVASFPLMTAAYGYLQIAFLNAAVMGTTYKGAGLGQIYSTGTAPHALVESEWGGNQFNVRALAGGSAPNAYTCSVSMTGNHASWGAATLTGGGANDDGQVNQTILVDTSGADLVMKLSDEAPDGTFAEFVMTDTDGGSVAIETESGVRLGTIFKSGAPLFYQYDPTLGWRSDEDLDNVYDFNRQGGVGDGVTDDSDAWATALRVAATQRLTIRMRAGTYYIATAPGAPIDAAVSDVNAVSYDWISLEAVGGPVILKSATVQTAAAQSAGKSASSAPILKAVGYGGEFRMKGVFIVDGSVTSTPSTFTGADPEAAVPLEVVGYDLFQFDELHVRNTYCNADMRADPDGAFYNPINDPLGSLRRGGMVIDSCGEVHGKLVVESIWREGPFVTAANIIRYLEFQYLNEIPYATRTPVSTPLNAFGTQEGSLGTLYGPSDADEYTYIKFVGTTGPWRGSIANIAGRGDFVLECTDEIAGLVPTTQVPYDAASATQYGPGIDFGSEINHSVTRSVELRGLKFRDNHRYSLNLARTSAANKITKLFGEVFVDGGWSGPNIQWVDFVDLTIRCVGVCNYTNETTYGTALRTYNVETGQCRIDLDGSRVVGTAVSRLGLATQYSGVVHRGRITDFYLAPISDNNVSGITDNTYTSLYADMEVVTSLYPVSSDGGALIRIGNGTSNRVKRAEISRLRLDGVSPLGTGRAAIYAVSLPGADSLTLGSGKVTLATDEFGVINFVNDDASSPGPGIKGRIYPVTDSAGRDAEFYVDTLLNAAGALQRFPLRGPSRRNISGVNYYPAPGFMMGAGTKVLAADTLYLLGWDGNLKTIGIGVDVTAAIAASSVYIGLYQGNVEGGFGELVEQSGALATATTGLKNYSWSTSRRRQSANQFLALVASHAITVRAYTSVDSRLQELNGVAAVTDTTSISHWTGAYPFAALPALASFPTMTGQTSAAPMIYARRG